MKIEAINQSLPIEQMQVLKKSIGLQQKPH